MNRNSIGRVKPHSILINMHYIAYLPVELPTCLCTCLYACLLTALSTYHPTYPILTFLPTYLVTYLPACLQTSFMQTHTIVQNIVHSYQWWMVPCKYSPPRVTSVTQFFGYNFYLY